jgi:hypothetical protein
MVTLGRTSVRTAMSSIGRGTPVAVTTTSLDTAGWSVTSSVVPSGGTLRSRVSVRKPESDTVTVIRPTRGAELARQ